MKQAGELIGAKTERRSLSSLLSLLPPQPQTATPHFNLDWFSSLAYFRTTETLGLAQWGNSSVCGVGISNWGQQKMGLILVSAALAYATWKACEKVGWEDYQVLLSGKDCGVFRISSHNSYISVRTFVIREGEICHSSFHEVLAFQNIILLCFKMKCPAKEKAGRGLFIHVFLETSKWYNVNLPRYWCYRSTTISQCPNGIRPSQQGTGGMSGKPDVAICPSSACSPLSHCTLHKLI